jgi:hypothetical protein
MLGNDSIFDDRPFDFGYLPVEVQCESCGSRFPHDQLQSDCFKDADGDERCSFDVCPICQHRDCCDVEYETLPFIEMSRLASENEKPG